MKKVYCWLIICISICICCGIALNEETYSVQGTVFSKNIEQYVVGKTYKGRVQTRYIMGVIPEDTEKFKPYSAYVDFITYSTYNVGDKITLKVGEDKCLKNYSNNEFLNCLLFVLLIFFGGGVIICISILLIPFVSK